MLAERFPPEFTGSGRQAFSLAQALAREGCRLTLLCSWPRGRPLPGSGDPGRVARLPGPPDGWRRSLSFACRSLIWLARHRADYDLIHVHGWTWAALAVPLLGKPCLYKTAIPGDDDPGTVRRTRGGRVKRLLLGRYSRYPAISTLVARMLEEDGIPKSRIAAIPNGVEERFNPGTPSDRAVAREAVRRRHGFGPGDPVVLYVGSLEPRKGTDILARAWPAVVRREPTARLLMVGPHHPASVFMRDVTADFGPHLGTTAVITGAVDDPLQLYRGADIFVFPSRNESFGNVLAEAMACGLPCVVSLIQGVTGDILRDGEDGLVVPAEDSAGLGAALAGLLGDATLRDRLGRAAVARIDARFRMAEIARSYRSHYLTLLGDRKRI
jgi:glycosyltransferase involved in cell wall biosynthesis